MGGESFSALVGVAIGVLARRLTQRRVAAAPLKDAALPRLRATLGRGNGKGAVRALSQTHPPTPFPFSRGLCYETFTGTAPKSKAVELGWAAALLAKS